MDHIPRTGAAPKALKDKQQPFPVERIATGRPGRMTWGHEREAKRMVDASNTTWKPHHRI